MPPVETHTVSVRVKSHRRTVEKEFDPVILLIKE
jgi:hypothetical protein